MQVTVTGLNDELRTLAFEEQEEAAPATPVSEGMPSNEPFRPSCISLQGATLRRRALIALCYGALFGVNAWIAWLFLDKVQDKRVMATRIWAPLVVMLVTLVLTLPVVILLRWHGDDDSAPPYLATGAMSIELNGMPGQQGVSDEESGTGIVEEDACEEIRFEVGRPAFEFEGDESVFVYVCGPAGMVAAVHEARGAGAMVLEEPFTW